jgi:hypothetical protein
MRFKVDAAERREAAADRLGQIHFGRTFCGQSLTKNLAQLGFHRVAVASSTATQLLLQRPLEVTPMAA